MEADGIDAEELKVFLQEAEEQLQLLDEDIIRLEHEADNGDLLQEIFRAAHTLKGSSGMLGFRKMAELTHAMEDLLDKLRNAELSVTPELVDALLAGIDGIKILKEGLASGSGDDDALDIEPLVARLRASTEAGGSAPARAGATRSLEEAVAADGEALERLEAA